MACSLLAVLALLGPSVSAGALTEQEIVDQLTADVAAAGLQTHATLPHQQSALGATLCLAADRAQLEMDLALRQLEVDFGLASAYLAAAPPAKASAARRQWLTAVTDGVTRYQQAIAVAYNAYVQRVGEIVQTTGRDGTAGVQTGLQHVANAHQRATNSMAGNPWGTARCILAPTLPSLGTQARAEVLRLAEADALAQQARLSYLSDLAKIMEASEEKLRAALAAGRPEGAGAAVTEELAALRAACEARYQQYDREVRQTLALP
jgi:hypothetical protein